MTKLDILDFLDIVRSGKHPTINSNADIVDIVKSFYGLDKSPTLASDLIH